MSGFVKDCAKRLVWLLLHLLYVLPVRKERIYFVAFGGLRYACNPKYVYECLLDSPGGGRYQYVWQFTDISKARLVPGARVVRSGTLHSIAMLLTSGTVFANDDIQWYIPLRKSQVYVQTWHAGGAYKKVGVSMDQSDRFRRTQLRNSRMVTFYLSSCGTFTRFQSAAKLVPEEKFLGTGLPRSSVLLAPHADLRASVRKRLALPADARVLLYAPTFRGRAGTKQQGTELSLPLCSEDFLSVVSSLERRFGGRWTVLFRAHNYDVLCRSGMERNVLDVTAYEDMQELCCAADVLLTDWSSCMWDFSLMGKPVFLYAPDIADYSRDDRGFFVPPEQWPYAVSTSAEELCRTIERFDEEQNAARVGEHLSYMQSFENERAAQSLLVRLGLMEGNA